MDIFKILEQQNRKKLELFNMVYQWGQWNVKADYTDMAFQKALKELIEYINGREVYGK